MTPNEVLDFVAENDLMDDLMNSMVNNNIGFAFMIVVNVMVKREGDRTYFLCPMSDGSRSQFPLDVEDERLIARAMSHPEHCQAAVMQMGDKYAAHLQYSRSQNAVATLVEETRLDFIRFAGIDSVEKLMHVLSTGYAIFKQTQHKQDNNHLIRDTKLKVFVKR
jgi:hypothetical protein